MKSKLRWLIPILLISLTAPISSAQPESRSESQGSDTWLLQVVLLVGRTSGPPGIESIPVNAHKAIEDIRDFLPYKSYEHLDTVLIRSAGHSRGMLKSPSGGEYQVSMGFRVDRREEGVRLNFQNFDLRSEARPPRGRGLAEGEAPRPPENVISTTFSVEVGETIVVGTSRLNGGDQALIVLLTAIP